MNKPQKYAVLLAVSIIVLSFIVWLAAGAEFFTKTQVLVERKDELFDTTYKEWQDKFVWGLDLTLAISGVSAAAGGVFYFFKRKRKTE